MLLFIIYNFMDIIKLRKVCKSKGIPESKEVIGQAVSSAVRICLFFCFESTENSRSTIPSSIFSAISSFSIKLNFYFRINNFVRITSYQLYAVIIIYIYRIQKNQILIFRSETFLYPLNFSILINISPKEITVF